MSRVLVATVAVALVAAGCGGDNDEAGRHAGAPAETTGVPSSTADSAPARKEPALGRRAPSANGGRHQRASRPRQLSRRRCPSGSYVSASFVGRRAFDSGFGRFALRGRGRGLELTVSGRKWRMRGVGRKPIRGRAAGISGTVRVHGSASGRLLDAGGGRLRFRRLATKGRVTLSALGTHFELPVAIVARSIVPDGVARVRCRRNRLTIHSASGVMRLTRR